MFFIYLLIFLLVSTVCIQQLRIHNLREHVEILEAEIEILKQMLKEGIEIIKRTSK